MAGWIIRLPKGAVQPPDVNCLWVVIDVRFPLSQPRIVIPEMGEDGTWPHVERGGLLCLKTTRISSDSGERIATHINWAIDLLNFSENTIKDEFEREFVTYWNRATGKNVPTGYCTFHPGGPSREIYHYFDRSKNEILWGEDKEYLVTLLRNTGRNPAAKEIKATLLLWLPHPLAPKSFPQKGKDVLNLVSNVNFRNVFKKSRSLPILLGASLKTGPVIAGVEISAAPDSELVKGFRPRKIPVQRIIDTMSYRPARRFSATRLDPEYIHGRGSNEHYRVLANKKVVIVGCGSLGGAITRLLAQAGVGNFVFIDPDILEPHNTARHVLGNRFVSRHKATAMAEMLKEDFPHLNPSEDYVQRIEELLPSQWEILEKCDLIISSGIDFIGDLSINRCRIMCNTAPVHLCSWAEPFALAGQCIAVFGSDDLSNTFDQDGYPRFELTNWPEDSQILFTEAGCSNMFQPHDSVDLQRIVLLAANMALDILKGTIKDSCWRTWQGDRDEVTRLGGQPSAMFKHSNVEQSHQCDWLRSP